ncbi:MAG: sulfatase-like hydrolase/transferase [Pirellulales bacterium]
MATSNRRGTQLVYLLLAPLMIVQGAAATCASAQTEPAFTEHRPNIVVILIDDLGTEWLGCYGGDAALTPRIDALAQSGTRFANFYAMPLCTPTRVTLLTGQYPFRHGWVDHWDVPRWGRGCHFDPDCHVTFPQLLQRAGYTTVIAGKWQINDFRVDPDVLRRHGFDDWCMWTGYETGNPPSAERYWNPYVHTRSGSKARPGEFGPSVFTDFLVDFIRAHRDGPLFVYYPMVLTHAPFTDTPFARGITGKLDRHRAMVRFTDHLVGRLLDTLDECGLCDDTYVFLLGDNGTAGSVTGRRNSVQIRGGKNSLGEAGVNVPLIVSRPGTTPSDVTCDALTDLSDIYPTVCQLASVEIPPSWFVDGRSFAPHIATDTLGRSAADSPRDWVLAMGQGMARATAEGPRPVRRHADRVIRGPRYKLWIENGAATRLFDLRDDPLETTNLIASADAETAQARERLIAVWRSQPSEDALRHYTPTPPQSWDAPAEQTKP